MAAACAAGATIYGLAKQFRCAWQTAALRLKVYKVQLRYQPLTGYQTGHFVALYNAGQSLERVGENTGFYNKIVFNYLRINGIQLRGTNGRRQSSSGREPNF